MGVLWAAEDETLGRAVAVKEIVPRADLPAGQRERALREARAAARVTHPCAVTVYDVVEEDGRPWIVMELLPPRTLADVLAEDGSLTPPAAARLGLDILDALAAAHAAGVLHRDVKPGNVLFAEGRAVLVDFGIASLDGDATISATGILLGSPAFMAPERARGERPTAASDLWSLGATLFTAVEGEAPFRRDGHLPTLAAVVTEEAPRAEHAGALRPLLTRLLARDPAERPTAEQARAALLAAATCVSAPSEPAPPVPAATLDTPTLAAADTAGIAVAVGPVPPQRSRRHGVLAAALLAPVAVSALALGGSLPWRHATSPRALPAPAPAAVTSTPRTPTATARTTTPGRAVTAGSGPGAGVSQRGSASTGPSAPQAVREVSRAGRAEGDVRDQDRDKDEGHEHGHDHGKGHGGGKH
jgi:eukaryotic-like serine/threonine-protein kinase